MMDSCSWLFRGGGTGGGSGGTGTPNMTDKISGIPIGTAACLADSRNLLSLSRSSTIVAHIRL